MKPILLQTLAEVVRSFPQWGERDALCLFNGYRILRYSHREIYDLTLRCAALLRDKGVEKGDRILIWAANRPEWGVAFCACALSGVVLVPLDARNTPEFVCHVGRETGAKLLLRSMTRRDPGLPIPTLFIDDLFDTLKTQPPLDRPADIHPDDTLEIVYTSGTTGNPKGVVLSHKNLASNVSDILDFIPIDGTYRLLSVLPLSHALEQTAGFWSPLAGGGSILYLHALKPSALFEAFQRDRITVMILVPRLLALLKQRIENTLHEKHMSAYLRWGMKFAPHLPRRLRKAYFYPVHKRLNAGFNLFVSGGSSLPRDVEIFWKRLGFELLQGYGLTETSPVLTATRPNQPRLGSVGQALRSVELRLSAEGEIQAKGQNVFSGYYQNLQATGEVFEEGWFKTGDIGERDSDGFFYIRSRKKDIIVTPDGINVYPEDIERILDAHPDIKESCVVGVGEHEEIVHAVLLLKDQASDLKTIIDEVNIQLPPEQRIESWSLWPRDEFPKTPTLKIKKTEVRKELKAEPASNGTSEIVQGTLLQQILCEMAGIPLASLRPDSQLGRDLGMSSIGRIELISRLEEEFRLDIGDEAVTAETTASDLERLVNQRASAAPTLHFRRLTLSAPCRAVRWLFHKTFMKLVLKIYCDLRCAGLENTRNLQGPILIVSNHTSHADTPLIMHLLPARVGDRICPAAWKEYFDTDGKPWIVRTGKWMAWQIATIFFNIFPFPQTAGYRRSMAYAGELVDKGWTILYFPEGGRTRDGSWGDIREGIGMLAQNLRIPILPVAIKGGEKILPAGAAWPRRNTVHIAFGAPFQLNGLHYRKAAERVKDEIMALWRELP